jgi:hypothetical protein
LLGVSFSFPAGQVIEVLLMNVSNIIKQHVDENPDKTAIIFEELCITYGEFDRLINRLAKRRYGHSSKCLAQRHQFRKDSLPTNGHHHGGDANLSLLGIGQWNLWHAV